MVSIFGFVFAFSLANYALEPLGFNDIHTLSLNIEPAEYTIILMPHQTKDEVMIRALPEGFELIQEQNTLSLAKKCDLIKKHEANRLVFLSDPSTVHVPTASILISFHPDVPLKINLSGGAWRMDYEQSPPVEMDLFTRNGQRCHMVTLLTGCMKELELCNFGTKSNSLISAELTIAGPGRSKVCLTLANANDLDKFTGKYGEKNQDICLPASISCIINSLASCWL